ncbi:AI-2E family transporter [Halegenticoccus tardaugens]|uniref:AI-2E family transporter n=1 Tax=Halegenticoccus tardaugens TaxID=2071624 RepID=UPI00100AB091|nr:AI-2E family transporter [Halegenticoccus tardaugens]
MVSDGSNTGAVRVWLAREHVAWWLLGLVFLGIVAFIAYEYLAWIVFGLFTYYVARPISRRIETRVGGASLAALVTLLLIIVPFVIFFAAFLLVALGQLTAVLSGLPIQAIINQLPVQVPQLPQTPEEMYQTGIVLIQEPSVQSGLAVVGGVLGAVSTTLYNMFLSVLFAFFLLVSGRQLSEWFRANIFDEGGLATDYFRGVDAGLTSVYFGYTMTIFAIMILTAIIYSVFNLFAPGTLAIPSVVLLGVVTGIFTLVPLVGRSIVYLFIALILGAQAVTTDPMLLWYPVVFLLVMAVVFDNVVRTSIRPYLSGRMFSTGLVMFAYLLGPALFGWYGIFLGPLLLVVIVVFIQRILPVLAHPEREHPSISTGPTLDEYVHHEKGGTDIPPGSDPETSP